MLVQRLVNVQYNTHGGSYDQSKLLLTSHLRAEHNTKYEFIKDTLVPIGTKGLQSISGERATKTLGARHQMSKTFGALPKLQ